MKKPPVINGFICTIFLGLMLLSSSCGTEPSSLNIFAAAGARPAISDICDKYQEKSGITVLASYGGGGEILSQMKLSCSGDIYIAPEQGFIEKAIEQNVIVPETVKTVAYMIPVIAVTKGNPKNIRGLSDLARPDIKISVTRPETTLLGKYAPEIFSKAGLTEDISKNIVTEAARPDNLLTMLVMGQVDAGIIWHFYQLQAPEQIENVYLLPGQLTGTGEMQAAVTTYCQDRKPAENFIDYLISTEGKEIFKKQGYIVNPEEVKKYWQ